MHRMKAIFKIIIFLATLAVCFLAVIWASGVNLITWVITIFLAGMAMTEILTSLKQPNEDRD